MSRPLAAPLAPGKVETPRVPEPEVSCGLATNTIPSSSKFARNVMLNKPVLLIIGGSGLVGEYLAKRAVPFWNITAAGHEAVLPTADSLQGWVRLDVRDQRQVREAIKHTRPDVVAHLAAISDIDACERAPTTAWEVNVEGAHNVATESARIGARIVFISSAAVFDGEKHGYREEDTPNPLSVYGRTKLEAERVVAAAVPQAVILRPSLVLGLSSKRKSNSLLNRWMDSWLEERAVSALTSEYRNPVDAETLADVMLTLAQEPRAEGIYHVGATDSVSRFGLARETARLLGYPDSLVTAQVEPQNGRAPRGRDHFLMTERLRTICQAPLGVCLDVIRRSVGELTQSSIRTGV